MTELEKTEKGFDYSFYDLDVAKVKEKACIKLNQMPINQYKEREKLIRTLVWR